MYVQAFGGTHNDGCALAEFFAYQMGVYGADGAVLPGVLTAPDIDGTRLSLAPLAEPPLWLDLVLIEPLRRPMSPAAGAFLEVLSEESARVNRVWLDVVAEAAE